MKKAIISLSAVVGLLFTACSTKPETAANEQATAVGESWPKAEKDAFIQQCVVNAKAQMDSAKAVSYCSCMQEKLMAKYPDIQALSKMSVEDLSKETRELAPDCLK